MPQGSSRCTRPVVGLVADPLIGLPADCLGFVGVEGGCLLVVEYFYVDVRVDEQSVEYFGTFDGCLAKAENRTERIRPSW